MFPSTRWTAIRDAGAEQPEALEAFAAEYREPVVRYVRARGFNAADADDLCQEAFLRLLRGKVLAKADAERGRFRSLLLTVVARTIVDRRRHASRRPEERLGDREPVDRDPGFDREWILHLSERALARLREQGSPYHAVLRDHLSGEPQERRRLHLARKRLIALIRDEVAQTCACPHELESELAYLTGFLRPT